MTETRRRFLELGMGGAANLLLSGRGRLCASPLDDDRAGAVCNPISELIKLEVKLAHWIRGHQEKILKAPLGVSRAKHVWVDYGFRWPAFTLTHLYKTQHADNSLYQERWCADLAMQLIDKEVACWHHTRDRGGRIGTGETPHYVVAYVLDQLGDRVSERRREQWREHEQAWVDQALVRPLGLTGGYHDSWRMTALYRLGKVFSQPAWCDRGVLLFKQLLARQTKEGFWEDDRHHGPSARYCGLMLPSLAWMYRWTSDEAFGDAARRLADFMATYAYPDGITVGAFDGRDCNVMGYFPICPGLELTESGRAYSARTFALWKDIGVTRDVTKAAQSTRDLARVAFYSADTCEYLSQFAPKPSQVIASKSPLPMDRDRVLENHTAEFDGLMARKGPWIVSLSSQNSNVRGIYRLERQSRIEIWHEDARLIMGGGHNHPDRTIPHANVILDNGYAGPSHFGTSPADESNKISRHYYRSRVARSSVVEGVPQLQTVFGHGTVRFRFLVENNLCKVQADWDVHGIERLCLQLPLVVWRGARLHIDGKQQADETYRLRPVNSGIQMLGGPFNSSVTVELPEGVPAAVHFPLWTGVFHGGAEEHRKDDPIRHWYDLALISCQWTKPPATGRAEFRINVGRTGGKDSLEK